MAPVDKALGSAPKLTDMGHAIVFNNEDGQDRSYMVHKATGRASKLGRAKGVYTIDAYMQRRLRSIGSASSPSRSYAFIAIFHTTSISSATT